MGPCIRDKLTGYWTTTNQFHTRFYSSAMKRWQVTSHSSLSSLQWKYLWAWHDGRKFWQVKEDAKSVWNSKQDIFKILEPFWTCGCRRSYCFVKRKDHFPTTHTQETNVLATKFTNHVTSLDISSFFPWRGWETFIQRLSIHPREWYTGNDGASPQSRIILNKGWSVSVRDGDSAKMSVCPASGVRKVFSKVWRK
jgi:hypothetical protein